MGFIYTLDPSLGLCKARLRSEARLRLVKRTRGETVSLNDLNRHGHLL